MGSSAGKRDRLSRRLRLAHSAESRRQRQERLENQVTRAVTFVDGLRQKLLALNSGTFSRLQAAERLRAVFAQLVSFEVGELEFQRALDVFFTRTCCERDVRVQITQLVEATEKLHQSTSELHEGLSIAKVYEAAQSFLSWYLTRRVTLIRLAQSAEENTDIVLSDLKIYHDRTQSGVDGFEIAFSLLVKGKRGSAYWIKAELLLRGDPVAAARGWESWTDTTDTFFGNPSRSGSSFAVLQPVHVSRQLMVSDDVRIFIPYDAIGTPFSSEDGAQIRVELQQSDGSVVAERSAALAFSATGDWAGGRRLLSPQSVSTWMQNLETRERILGARILAESSCELALEFDLALGVAAEESYAVRLEFFDRARKKIDSVALERCPGFSVNNSLAFSHIIKRVRIDLHTLTSIEKLMQADFVLIRLRRVGDRQEFGMAVSLP